MQRDLGGEEGAQVGRGARLAEGPGQQEDKERENRHPVPRLESVDVVVADFGPGKVHRQDDPDGEQGESDRGGAADSAPASGGRGPAGGAEGDAARNAAVGAIDHAFGRLFPQVEAYPELKAHQAIADALQQNAYLQKEITAARALYNDTVAQWNSDIFRWPTKMIVAARAGYTTRIPFTASAETRQQARGTFF